MKLIMESWRRFIEESESSTKSFAFSTEEIDALNGAIKKITSVSQRIQLTAIHALQRQLGHASADATRTT